MSRVGRKEFLAKIKPFLAPSDFELIKFIYGSTKCGHINQERDDGSRYFEHPKYTALILIDELGIFDFEEVAKAIFHDIIEESYLYTLSIIERFFGKDIAIGVGLLTDDESKKNYLGLMLKYGDQGVQIVKLCDRFHNLRTLCSCTKEKQERKLKETRDKYLPFIDACISNTKEEKYIKAFKYLKKEIIKAYDSCDISLREHTT